MTTENTHKNLLQLLPQIIWLGTARAGAEYFSPAWFQYTGVNAEDSLQWGWKKAIDPQDIEAVMQEWISEQKEQKCLEVRIRNRAGTSRWHSFLAHHFLDEAQGVLKRMVVCTDIHARKTLELEQTDKLQQAERANKEKGQFLEKISREMRTPLNAILGFADLLLEPQISLEERRDAASTIKSNSHRLLGLAEEIVSLSKAGSGQIKIRAREVNILNFLLSVKPADCRFQIANDIPTKVIVDPECLHQVLLIVLTQASAFSISGSIYMNVRFVPKADGKEAFCFTIGTGHLRRHESSSMAGFEISQAQKMARSMGGDIEKTKTEMGEAFIVDIPVNLPAEVTWTHDFLAIDDDTPVDLNALLVQRLKGRRVLLVEDAPDNQVLMERFLRGAGLEVDTADNGAEAVTKALAFDYSAVLMDIQMPVLDGYAATSSLRSKGYKRPIIALTAHALKEEKEKCLQAGCDEHLTKPISRTALVNSLARLIEV